MQACKGCGYEPALGQSLLAWTAASRRALLESASSQLHGQRPCVAAASTRLGWGCPADSCLVALRGRRQHGREVGVGGGARVRVRPEHAGAVEHHGAALPQRLRRLLGHQRLVDLRGVAAQAGRQGGRSARGAIALRACSGISGVQTRAAVGAWAARELEGGRAERHARAAARKSNVDEEEQPRTFSTYSRPWPAAPAYLEGSKHTNSSDTRDSKRALAFSTSLRSWSAPLSCRALMARGVSALKKVALQGRVGGARGGAGSNSLQSQAALTAAPA